MTVEDVDIANSALIKLGAKTISALDAGSRAADILNEQFTKVRDAVFRLHPWNSILNRVKLTQFTSTITNVVIGSDSDPVVFWSASHPFRDGDFVEIDGIVGTTELNGYSYEVYDKAASNFKIKDEDGTIITAAGKSAYVSGGTAIRVPWFQYEYAYQLPSDYIRSIQLTDRTGTEDYLFVREGNAILTDQSECWLSYIAQVDDPDAWDATLREAMATALAVDVALALTGSRTLAAQARQAEADDIPTARSIDGQEGGIAIIDQSEWETVR